MDQPQKWPNWGKKLQIFLSLILRLLIGRNFCMIVKYDKAAIASIISLRGYSGDFLTGLYFDFIH